MHVPNQLKIAAATIIVVGGVSHSTLPASHDKTGAAATQREYHRQYRHHRERELEEMRLKADRDADAIHRDRLRAAEVRPKNEETAAKAVRGLLRRRP